jgi:UDPglucose--hexose-1-phosphate uridylyltransferase
LCAGREGEAGPELYVARDGGGWRVRVIPHRNPVLRVEGLLGSSEDPYEQMSGVGAHEIVVETPEHGQRLSELSAVQIGDVLWAARERMTDLRRDHRLVYATLFRNQERREQHGNWQLIVLPRVPDGVKAEVVRGQRYFESHGRCLMCDVLKREEAEGSRIVLANEHCLALAPYGARVPFETWIVPRVHESHCQYGPRHVMESAAAALWLAVRKIDAALERPAYTVTLHNGLLQEGASLHGHWRLEIVPRIAYGAGPGFEWAADMHVNPTSPEAAAAFLRHAPAD